MMLEATLMTPLAPTYLSAPIFREYKSPGGRTVYWSDLDGFGPLPAESDHPLCMDGGWATVTPLSWSCGLPVEPGELTL